MEFLWSEYEEVFEAFSSKEAEQDHADAVLLELNKTARELSESPITSTIHSVQQALGLEEVSVTLWEVPEREDFPPSAVFWVSGEIHLAVKLAALNPESEAQTQTLIASELRRWQFWNLQEGVFRVTERLLSTLAEELRADGHAYRETWDRWNLATEKLAHQTGDDATGFTTGAWDLEQLDILEQQAVSAETRRVICRLLNPTWFQTVPVLAHARGFFADFATGEISEEPKPSQQDLQETLHSPQWCNYLCYVLLDFAVVDQTLAEKSFSQCLNLARNSSCEARFTELLREELDWSAEQIDALTKTESL